MRVSSVRIMQQFNEYKGRQTLMPIEPFHTSSHYKVVPLLVVLILFTSACAQVNTKITPNDPLPTNESGQAADGAPTSPVVKVDLPVSEPHDILLQPLDLRLCKTNISNPPKAKNMQVLRGSSIGCLNDVALQIATAPGACLTSGYGPRGKKLHKGVDYQSKPAGSVVAAAGGKIVISKFREKDLGNWIVIDHGSGVYTAYGHLASVDAAIRPDSSVSAGQVLGIMGKTGNATNSIHLHYEVRHGKPGSFRNFFLLDPIDPYSLPESCPPAGLLANG